MFNAQLEHPQKSMNYEDQKYIEMIREFELKKSLLYGPSLGVYLLPSLDDLKIWNGLIFIRHGYYKEGKFKFNLSLKTFPTHPPSVYFLTKVYHPLIDLTTGQLDVNTLLRTQWVYPDQAMLYTLINSLQKMFSQQQCLRQTKSFNPQAAKMYHENISEFALHTIKSVQESLIYLQFDITGNSIILKPIPEFENQSMRKQLEQACSYNRSVDQKINAFMETII